MESALKNLAEETEELEADIERLRQVQEQSCSAIISYSSEDEDESEDEESEIEISGKLKKIQEKKLIKSSIVSSHTSEYDEDLHVSSDDGDCVTEPTLEKCLYLNHVYQDLIQESIEDIELLLKLNRENQQALQDKKMSTFKKPSKRLQTSLSYPYFKDSHGHIPPNNEDTKTKTSNCELNSSVVPAKPWSNEEKEKLLNFVKRNAFEKTLQKVMSRKEILLMELREFKLTPTEIIKKEKQVEEKDAEISILQSPMCDSPIGPIETEYDWLKISVIDFEGSRSGLECELFWKNYLHPSINKRKWSNDEVNTLTALVEFKGHHAWEKIAQDLKTNRTGLQCFEKYRTKISNDNLKGKWTLEERNKLMKLVDTFRIGDHIPWHQVSYFMEERTWSQTYHQWTYHLNPCIRKGKWMEQEDMLLVCAVWMLGPKQWFKIQNYVPGRTSVQCNERWRNSLDPTLLFTDWTAEEDSLILDLVPKYKKRWSLCARHLPGRTGQQISVRYEALTRTVSGELSAFSVNSFATSAKIQEDYRASIYRGVATCVKGFIRTHGIFIELDKISKKTIMVSIIEAIMAGEDKSITRTHRLNEQNLIDALLLLSVEELKNVIAPSRRRRKVPGTHAVDQEIDSYFEMVNQKKKRGRPPRLVQFDEENPVYINWIDKIKGAFPKQSEEVEFTWQNLQFLPPTARSLQAFRSTLMQKKRLQTLPLSRSPKSRLPSKTEQHSTNSAQDEENPVGNSMEDVSYKLLFTRFCSLFLWPALLSVIKPEEETVQRRPKKRQPQVRNASYKKKKRKISSSGGVASALKLLQPKGEMPNEDQAQTLNVGAVEPERQKRKRIMVIPGPPTRRSSRLDRDKGTTEL